MKLLKNLVSLRQSSLYKGGYCLVRKPAKVYLDNPNLYYLFSGHAFSPQIGSIRECFFVNQVSSKYSVHAASRGDFAVEDFVFEIGGKRKTKKQISQEEQALLVLDDIEIGVDIKYRFICLVFFIEDK